MKFSLGSNKPVSGQACVLIEIDAKEVFTFVAENFFLNYPKWATDVVELEPLDGNQIFVGAKGRQVRKDNEALIESIFAIIKYDPYTIFALQGLDAPYRQTYSIEKKALRKNTELTFSFELLEIEIFMRPFEKLIRVAIEDGAEAAVENIKNLLTTSTASAL
jgi:Polyketide cyclase / dehydrase and lipid transport